MTNDDWREIVAELEAENERLRDGLKLVREIIKDGAMTGFNPLDGDWATRLFESQGITHRLVKGR